MRTPQALLDCCLDICRTCVVYTTHAAQAQPRATIVPVGISFPLRRFRPQTKGFAAADAALELPGTLLALEHDNDLFGGLSLFVENRLSLAAKALLLAVVSPLPLRDQRVFPLLVLRHLVRHVHVALAAVSPHLLGEADHGQ